MWYSVIGWLEEKVGNIIERYQNRRRVLESGWSFEEFEMLKGAYTQHFEECDLRYIHPMYFTCKEKDNKYCIDPIPDEFFEI